VKRTKYGNVKTHGFDSRAEYHRYLELLILEKAGKIYMLKRQTEFPIVVNGVKVCRYRADFTYDDGTKNGVVEDVKGVRTAIYRLKKKLMLACYGITIKEVSAKDLGIRRKL